MSRRRRRLGLGLALLAVAALGVYGWARLLAGGPVIPGVPGGWLRGERVTTPPVDWSFANRDPYLLVESRAGALPYSARVWFIAHEGRLHLLLPGFFGDDLQQRLSHDPRLRVAIDGRLYEQVAVEITDDRNLADLVRPVLRRQFAIEVEGTVQTVRGAAVEMAVYRLDDPPPERR